MEKCGGANRIRVPTHIATTPLSPSIRSGVPVKSTHAFAATRSRPLHRSKLASCRAALQGEALSAPKLSGAYSALSAVSGVYLVSSQSEVAPASLWRPDERCVLVRAHPWASARRQPTAGQQRNLSLLLVMHPLSRTASCRRWVDLWDDPSAGPWPGS